MLTSEVAGMLICGTFKSYQTSVMYSEAVQVETIVFNAEMDRNIVQVFLHISYQHCHVNRKVLLKISATVFPGTYVSIYVEVKFIYEGFIYCNFISGSLNLSVVAFG